MNKKIGSCEDTKIDKKACIFLKLRQQDWYHSPLKFSYYYLKVNGNFLLDLAELDWLKDAVEACQNVLKYTVPANTT